MKCPVCEHDQLTGLECEVCGKNLSGLAGAPREVPILPIDELEVTIPDRIGDVPLELVGDLEVTRYEAVEAGPLDASGLDLDRAAPVGDVVTEPVEISEDRVMDDGQRTALPDFEAVTCRYCRNVQSLSVGTVCEKCGMALPKVPVLSGIIVGATLEDVKTRCRMCGAPATAGKRCGDCGRDVPFPDA